jgi:hypothetical protein
MQSTNDNDQADEDSILMEDESERNARRMSVRRKFADLLTHFDNNPFSMVLAAAKLTSMSSLQDDCDDEDYQYLSAAKKPRFETAQVNADEDTVTVTTTASSDEVAAVSIAPTGTDALITVAVPVAASLSTGSASRASAPPPPHVRATSRTWTLQEDQKLTDAVQQKGKDWVAVAALVPGRLNYQCRQRWVTSLDPACQRTAPGPSGLSGERNKGKWTVEEDAQLMDAVQKHGGNNNWVPVAALVPGRTDKQCRQRWSKTLDPNINTGKWTPEEDATLTRVIHEQGNDWVRVACQVPGRTNTQCRSRWVTVLDPTIDQTGARKNKEKWTGQEDAQLIEAVTKHGNSWIAVSSLVPGRTNAQCRQRWDRSLDPNIQVALDVATARKNKNLWSKKEDRTLIQGVKKHGNSWVAVAALIPGRTNTQCRQRWYRSLDPNMDKTTDSTGTTALDTQG